MIWLPMHPEQDTLKSDTPLQLEVNGKINYEIKEDVRSAEISKV